jgi:hypothetical protein
LPSIAVNLETQLGGLELWAKEANKPEKPKENMRNPSEEMRVITSETRNIFTCFVCELLHKHLTHSPILITRVMALMSA